MAESTAVELNWEYGAYEADLITHSILDETAILSDGPIMICAERSVLLSRDQQCQGPLGTDTECQRGVESPFPTAHSVLPSASDRDA